MNSFFHNNFKKKKQDSSLSANFGDSQKLFVSESIRGEKTHWKINCILYPMVLILSLFTYFFQRNTIAGMAGILLSTVNILYNFFLSFLLHQNKYLPKIGYITITLNLISLTVYNYLDALYNSDFLPATSATLLLYPILIFLASLRLNKTLIAYTTILCITVMDGLYAYFYVFHHLNAFLIGDSTDWLSQGYRSIYLAIIGCMVYYIPRKIHRLLSKQETLLREKSYHQAKAETDSLTGLYNRYYLENYFHNRVQNPNITNEFALFYIDLNDFKRINDTYGHEYGDFILASIAKDLLKSVKDKGITARYGGDELVILYQIPANLDKNQNVYLEELAQDILDSISIPRTFKNTTFTIHASIGISIYPDQATTLADLLQKADQTMYSIKKQKKHGYRFYSKDSSFE